MLEVRKAGERGHADHGWLHSFHTFSFADYYDPRHMGFGRCASSTRTACSRARASARTAHRDMEIITYVLEGALEHKDCMGNGSVIRPGDVQRMSAGTGVQHSEFNASQERARALPPDLDRAERRGIAPGYEQKHFDAARKRGRLRLVASPDGRDGSVDDPPGRVRVRGAARRAERATHALAAGPARLRPRRARQGDGRTASRSPPATR